MDDIDDFLELLRDELGLPVEAADVDLSLDAVAGWDSVHLLALLTLVERRTGHAPMLPDLLEAGSIREIYSVAARTGSAA
ncbi:phosphopantetheine-binding protein [Actinomadura sp. GTD37]|uniref:phosphopantetheine-binding protein n=1 Tax=Actinomadura sp. GTD37 TaxID=1778030 RepID=UPI0035C0009C